MSTIKLQNDDNKQQYAKAICQFLAEQLRVHKISLVRAADIAGKFLENLNLIDSEEHFLRLVKQLSNDFEELVHLEEKIFLHIQQKDHRKLEAQIRDFVIGILATDPKQALAILKEATANSELNQESLVIKFPQFHEFTRGN